MWLRFPLKDFSMLKKDKFHYTREKERYIDTTRDDKESVLLPLHKKSVFFFA